MAMFYARTKTPQFGDVHTDIRRVLAGLPPDYHVCFEFKLRRGYDVVIIHRRGIHVIEVKNERMIVTGGPQAPVWTLRYEDGTPKDPGYENPYGQVTDCANQLKLFLQSRSKYITTSPCSPRPCLPHQPCNRHSVFWIPCCVFPYLCIPQWNPKNQIDPDSWCWLTHGTENLRIRECKHLLDAILSRDWTTNPNPKTRPLSLNETEIERIIAELGLVAISEEVALGNVLHLRPSPPDDNVERFLREKELFELDKRLQERPIIAIVGPSRIGKTSLARLLEADLAKSEGHFLERDFRDRDVPLTVVLEDFLYKMKASIQQFRHDNIGVFLGVLERERYIIVLDNFEKRLDTDGVITNLELSQLIDMLLTQSSKLQSLVILTSQSSVRTQSQVKVPELQLEGVDQAAALRFLQDKYEWSETEAASIYRATRNGQPYDMHVFSDKINDNLGLGYSFEEALVKARLQLFEHTYKERYAKLSPDEGFVRDSAALYPEGMRIQGIEWMADRFRIKGSTADAARRLHHKRLINIAGEKWIQIHPNDHQFVYESIANKQQMHRAILEFYKQEARKLEAGLGREAEAEEAYQRLFYHAIAAKEAKEAWNALFDSPFGSRLEASGRYDTLAYNCKQLRECEEFDALSPRERGKTVFAHGRALLQFSDLEPAERDLDEAERLFTQASDVVGQASALWELGLLARKKGQLGRKESEYYELALAMLEGQEDLEAKRVQSQVLGRMAHALESEGRDSQEILQYHQKALALAREVGDPSVLATRLSRLGAFYRETVRDFETAIRYLQEAIDITRQMGWDAQVAVHLSGLGKLYMKSRDKDKVTAEQIFLEALEKTPATDVYGMLDRLGNLATVYTSLEIYDKAESYYTRTIDLARKNQDKKAESASLAGLGAVFRTRALKPENKSRKASLLHQALECHQNAAALQEQIEDKVADRIHRYQQLARTLYALEDFGQAYKYFLKSLQESSRSGRMHLEAWQFRRLGDTVAKLGRPEEAVLIYQKAAELFGDDPQLRGKCKESQRKILQKMDAQSRSRVEVRLRSVNEEIEHILTQC